MRVQDIPGWESSNNVTDTMERFYGVNECMNKAWEFGVSAVSLLTACHGSLTDFFLYSFREKQDKFKKKKKKKFSFC